MPRPRSLTESGIATAALAVIDRDGTDALSMRAVAAELGVGTMSLYRYVAGREQLEGLVVDLVLDRVETAVPARASWDAQVTLLVERVRAAVGAHPAIVPFVLTQRQNSEGARAWAEAVLAALSARGSTKKATAIAFRTLLSYVIGSVQVEHYGSLAGTGTATLADLPVAQYPHLAATAKRARRIAPDEEFRRGLEVVLRGLAVDATRATDTSGATGSVSSTRTRSRR